MNQHERLLLKPDEAAHVLGCGRTKVYALIADGVLPSLRLGNSLRVPLRALSQWIDERAATAPRNSEGTRRARGPGVGT